MKNKNVGILIIGIAVVLGIIVFLFNNALKDITASSCSMGSECTMYSAIKMQNYISTALIAVIIILGIIIMLLKEEKHIVTKTITEREIKAKKIRVNMADLNSEEKKIVGILVNSKGSMFQSELVEKAGFDKVKVSRILDRLEGRQMIERRRRGMTNIVILKQ